ncbi:hypothetical protein BSZ39_04310 [Bowdeniella nasicola]|uniref:Uncharacterized protein n=2 Tax=Bowdeniella nasicola TaxID=208480 RepID=A0A1Q5Q3M6_9ACTO|nr:hypothetical protein BSZ39_04310 [Bowdeniella nasicola]
MRDHMASVASSRAKGWREISRATAPVSEDFVADLRDGTWISRILDSMAWTNEGGERLVATARTILPFERGAASRPLASDVVELQHGNDGDPDLSARCAQQYEWCAAEADAWSSGDEAGGRELRLRQFTDLDGALLDDLIDHCNGLVTGLHSDIHVVIARVITAFLALESGRNLTDPLP